MKKIVMYKIVVRADSRKIIEEAISNNAHFYSFNEALKACKFLNEINGTHFYFPKKVEITIFENGNQFIVNRPKKVEIKIFENSNQFIVNRLENKIENNEVLKRGINSDSTTYKAYQDNIKKLKNQIEQIKEEDNCL